MTSTTKPSEKLPSLVFAIPLPKPAQASVKKKSPTFALYTFPRSIYEKPTKDATTGKRSKEKIVKKIERKWQHEVKEGQDVKKGVIKDVGLWKRFKSNMINVAASIIQWMPSNVIEALSRLPPIKKLGKLFVYFPNPAEIPPWFNLPAELNEKKIDHSFFNLLTTAKDKSKTRSIASGCLLPFTLAIDILLIIPLFIFEINLAFFIMQVNGSKKASRFVKAQNKLNEETVTGKDREGAMCEFKPIDATRFGPTIEHLYSICSNLDPVKFPINHSISQPTYEANKDIATGLIQIFTESVPPHVISRHILDENLIAADLDRSLRKAAKEYIRILS